MLLTLAALAVVLGPLIFVHEMGHFLAAKAVGVQVLRFSIGFGRPLWRRRRGETEYWLSWIPLGGYVKLATLEEEGPAGALEGGAAAVSIDPGRVIENKSVPARLVVMLAGVTMNALLAFFIFTGLAATVGSPELNTTQVDSVVVSKLPPGAQALATLASGDRIVRINGDSVRTWDDLARAIMSGPSELRFQVAGRAEAVLVQLDQGGLTRRQAVLEALVPRAPIAVGRLEPRRAAARAGIKSGDEIVSVDGVPLRSVDQFLARVWDSPKKALQLGIRRGNDTLSVTVIPEEATGTDARYPKRPPVYGLIGAELRAAVVRVRHPGADAIIAGWSETRRATGLVVGVLKGLVLRQVSVREIGGPILVAQASGQAARLGLDWLLRFIAFFSINLAVLNLLPIPILDGGQVLFLLIEAVRRKPLSVEVRTRLSQIGFLVVLGLMALALANDVLRILPR